jgi:DNA-binding GntR family transcriptional regulator
VAERLGVEEGSTVAQIKRVRLINREPVSLEITYLSQALGERLENADLVTRDMMRLRSRSRSWACSGTLDRGDKATVDSFIRTTCHNEL